MRWSQRRDKLIAALRAKGNEYLDVLKMGRTEMQDAVPMTVGQEFHAFAAGLESEIAFLRQAEQSLYPINMGGTAIGTAINTLPGYAEAVAKHLSDQTGKPFRVADDLLTASWDQQAFAVESAAASQSRH